MLQDFKLKDMSYIIMIIVIVVCMVVMVQEKVDVCYGLICLMGSLLTGLFYILFFDVD